MKTPRSLEDSEALRKTIREGYSRIAATGSARRQSGKSCCGAATITPEKLATAIGYSSADIQTLPEGANMGLSCGNPAALAELRAGEVVLDLGAGGGFDVFLAGGKVGPTGRVIGVDMTPEMLVKARANVPMYQARSGLENVEFRLGEIEYLPVADQSVDVIISNCVLNLSPDKPQVWREIARALKPGGRVAVSDLALLAPLPEQIREMTTALVGCVAGAVLISETEAMVKAAGLVDVLLTRKSGYLEALTNGDDPLYRKIMEQLPPDKTPADYITSLEVKARKPF